MADCAGKSKQDKSSSQIFSAKHDHRSTRRQCVGCVVLKGDAVDPYMVCARLRWTRNGMKTLMHILNGADPWQKHRIDQAVRNCTANELRRLASGVTKLWEDPLLPWCPKAAMQSATKVYPHLLAVVQQEVARRAAGGKYEPDQLSRAMLVRLNYIQLYRTPRARQVLNIHMNTGITQVLPLKVTKNRGREHCVN